MLVACSPVSSSDHSSALLLQLCIEIGASIVVGGPLLGMLFLQTARLEPFQAQGGSRGIFPDLDASSGTCASETRGGVGKRATK